MGLTAIDLLEPVDWPVVREHGLICSMGYGGGGSIREGLNNPANHDRDRRQPDRGDAEGRRARRAQPDHVLRQPPGPRRSRSDRQLRHRAQSSQGRLPRRHGVTICVELLNSKVDHADYHGDRTPFGVQIVAAVNSPRVKLLYDIYHMQIMEGDVIRTIRDHHQHIAHYHTGGVPGRHELDDTQELQWPAVCRAIVDTGFKGYSRARVRADARPADVATRSRRAVRCLATRPVQKERPE